MAFETLAQHVAALGGLKPVGTTTPIDGAMQADLERTIGAPLPSALSWWLAKYGGGVMFVKPVVYRVDVVLGWFMELDEIRQLLDAYSESLAPRRLPVINDGSDNLIVVDTDGSVWEHIHDAPPDDNSTRIADSFEAFILSLRIGD